MLGLVEAGSTPVEIGETLETLRYTNFDDTLHGSSTAPCISTRSPGRLLDPTPQEFPRLDERRLGQPYRYAMRWR